MEQKLIFQNLGLIKNNNNKVLMLEKILKCLSKSASRHRWLTQLGVANRTTRK